MITPSIHPESTVQHRRGLMFVFAAGVLWSTVGLGIRLIEDASVWQILFYRSISLTLLLYIVIRWRTGQDPFALVWRAGLAGASSDRFHVWLADWRAESVDADSAFPVRLVVNDDTFALDLTLSLDKPLVFQGDGGWSRKGAEIGNASYYYSATRLGATGIVRNARGEFDVTGSAWLDREWSTSVLSEGQTGWDWFSIQFDDGRDLMMYRLRREDGGNDPFNKGTLIEADGTTIALRSDDLEFEPGRQVDGFHVEWTLRVKPLDLEIQVTPMLENSILPVSVRYWEGAIRTDPPGVGFMEMTTNEGLSR